MSPAINRILIAVAALTIAAPVLADPPARVGRLSLVRGSVSLAPAGADDQWTEAFVNWPITYGDRLWAADRSRAEVRIGSTSVRLDERTSADVLALDDRDVQLSVAQGRLELRVRSMRSDSRYEIDTPGAAIVVRRPGVYRVDVRPDAEVTTLVVRDGEADMSGDQASVDVRAGEQVVFVNGGESYDYYSINGEDDFDRFCFARDSRDDRRAARYVSVEMTGYEDLAEYGSWSTVPDYGNVWFPSRVDASWAPYRDGRWAWVEPWGWTWVDGQPWGFAPFHYGRWVRVSDRWGWVPGEAVAQPVYAPALVGWVGGANFSVSVSTGTAPVVGWFPLAYREPYIPWYDASPTYVREVNVPAQVTNINVTNINVTQINYKYRADPVAVTAVPAQVVVQAQPVTQAAVRLQPQQLAQAPIVAGAAPVAPKPQSVIVRAASVRPPAQVEQRKVIAVQAPPPPPPSFAAREQAIAQHGDKPFKVAALPPRAAAAAAPTAPAAPGAAPAAPGAAPAAPGKAAPLTPAGRPTAPVQVVKAPAPKARAAGAAPPPAPPGAPAAAEAAKAKAPEAAKAAGAPPKGAEPAKAAEAPKAATEAPKSAAEAAKGPAVPPKAAEAPKAAAEAPKAAAEAPKAAAEAPKGAAEAPKGAPEAAKGAPEPRQGPEAAKERPGAPSSERLAPGKTAEPPRATPPTPAPRDATPTPTPREATPPPAPPTRATPQSERAIPQPPERGGPPSERGTPRPTPERATPPTPAPPVERATPREAPPAPQAAPPTSSPSPQERSAARPTPERATPPTPAPPVERATPREASPHAAPPTPPAERAAPRPAPERAAPPPEEHAPPAPPRGAPPEREPQAKGKAPPEKGKSQEERKQEEQRG